MQDKYMVVMLARSEYLEWLDAPAERSMELMNQLSAERLVAARS
jgi:putative SOS response-associated peptidase YedK